mmetsp:Transcript_5712/g.18938  ORF Transcript_5712/g.18938 Transcript_5712/m.18938 type:complete len:91 (-) Transcript_5712:499-771(-)
MRAMSHLVITLRLIKTGPAPQPTARLLPTTLMEKRFMHTKDCPKAPTRHSQIREIRRRSVTLSGAAALHRSGCAWGSRMFQSSARFQEQA